MNKKLIALAVAAGMAAPMAAQAEATWYGQVQMEVGSHSSDFLDEGAIPAEFDDSAGFLGGFAGSLTDGHIWQGGGPTSSRWLKDGTQLEDDKRGRLGVKGSEDLGGGLAAIYQFEFQVDTSTGDADDGDRNSFVGLKGGFGTIKAGTLKSPYKYFGGVSYDPFVTTSAEARRYGGMTSGQFGSNGFWTNSVSYQNDFGGANLWITYTPDERNNRDGDYAAGLKFAGSNYEAFVAMAHDNDTNNTEEVATFDPAFDALKVGGQFKSGPHKLSAQYEMTTNEEPYGAGSDDNEGTVMYVNYDMKMGKNIFTATYGMSELEVGGAGGDSAEGTFMRVGMTHKFSKSTRAMLAYSTAEIDYSGFGVGSLNTFSKDVLMGAMRVDF
ncbi:porin [Thiohalophilus sp.]|uniref:porin n=1 Tax=Thiohalophilus sp. TaxID=3028392 RepID=UPI002ACE4B7A|nr:porin [Thiohalophilus sp.]MDZ7661961.1 porin [Thiohalophilus sp.]